VDINVVESVDYVLKNSINHVNKNVIKFYYVVINVNYSVLQNVISVKINVK